MMLLFDIFGTLPDFLYKKGSSQGIRVNNFRET